VNLHEYQSKMLLKALGIPVLNGYLCYTPGEVEAAAWNLGGGVCVVKAQVHAGGRGKGGGVKVAKTPADARAHGSSILGMNLITPQTGEKGKKVHKVYVEAGCAIQREFYLSVLLDRAKRSIAIVASSEGGMDIEEVAEHTPEKITTVHIATEAGLQRFQCAQVARSLGLSAEEGKKLTPILMRLYEAYLTYDFALVEINPLVLTASGDFVVLDAKCAIEDNALFRQPHLSTLLDYDESDPKDIRAAKSGLSYVALDGNIGCMVNGAGLAMATMDIIKLFGGEPANFLDVGGGASRETVTEAFKILLSDTQVKGILVNIFGGIMKCDVIAQGIVDAAKELGVRIPLVVRLQGTNVELGKEILASSGLTITSASTMDEAARKIIEAVK
jgi:succinyl-CoA synthetase beta subunit